MLRSSVVSANSVPSAGGMLPLRLSLDSSTSVTRLGAPPVVIPSQLVMARSALQSNVAVPAGVSLAASNASQSLQESAIVFRGRFGLAPLRYRQR